MKRAFIILLSSLVAAPVFAQADAVALAAQREAEENLKRLSSAVQEVQEGQGKQQERISALAGEVEKLRSEVAKANNNAATQDAISKLGAEIKKVDEARIADNKRIYSALEDLKKLILERPTAPKMPAIPTGQVTGNLGTSTTGSGVSNGGTTSKAPVRNSGNATEEGYEYKIQSGDRLDLIVKAYRAQGINVTSKMIMDANPTVKWERLKIGQTIFIPKPK